LNVDCEREEGIVNRRTLILCVSIIVIFHASPASAFDMLAEGRTLTTAEIVLSAASLVFAAIVIGIAALMRARKLFSADVAFKLIGLALVIGSSMFLVAAGYSQQQITPVVGLLGTALGFVFGKTTRNPEREASRPSDGGVAARAR
jgi:hypothetical protein